MSTNFFQSFRNLLQTVQHGKHRYANCHFPTCSRTISSLTVTPLFSYFVPILFYSILTFLLSEWNGRNFCQWNKHQFNFLSRFICPISLNVNLNHYLFCIFSYIVRWIIRKIEREVKDPFFGKEIFTYQNISKFYFSQRNLMIDCIVYWCYRDWIIIFPGKWI